MLDQNLRRQSLSQKDPDMKPGAPEESASLGPFVGLFTSKWMWQELQNLSICYRFTC